MKNHIKNFLGTVLFSAVALSFIFPLQFAEAARTAVQSVSGYFTVSSDDATSIYYTTGAVGIGTAAPTATNLSLKGYATSSPNAILNIASSTNSTLFSVGPTGQVLAAGINGIGTPTIATSTGLGATSTISLLGTDFGGIITATTSQSTAAQNPQTLATLFTLTFASSSAAYCTYSPATTTSAQLSGSTTPIMIPTTTGFSLKSNITALAATTSYAWTYRCN